MMRAGALSYILKDTTPEDLIAALRKTAIGESTASPRIAEALVTAVTRAREATTPEDQLHEELTERGMEVLQCFAEGLSNMSIAA